MLKVNHTHIECPALVCLAVLASESATEFRVAIAGGAARDAFHNVEPNDHDIVIYGYGGENHDEVAGAVLLALHDAGYDCDASYADDGRYDGTPQLHEVGSFHHSVFPDVDVLFYPDVQTLAEAVTVNDFNFNHFAVVIEDVVYREIQQAYYFGETNVDIIKRDGDLLPVDHPMHCPLPPVNVLRHLVQHHEVSDERLDYIREKAHNYGWTIPDSLRG